MRIFDRIERRFFHNLSRPSGRLTLAVSLAERKKKKNENKMKIIILFILILSFTSCNSFFQLNSDKELTEKINSEYLKEKKPIDLTKITDFEWDNYIVIGPYKIREEVEKKYNIDLSNISKYETADDSKNLLVLIKNKKSIKICLVKVETKFIENKLLKIE